MDIFNLQIFQLDKPMVLSKEKQQEGLPEKKEKVEIVSSVIDLYRPHTTVESFSQIVFIGH